jgi:hypothetical protein
MLLYSDGRLQLNLNMTILNAGEKFQCRFTAAVVYSETVDQQLRFLAQDVSMPLYSGGKLQLILLTSQRSTR